MHVNYNNLTVVGIYQLHINRPLIYSENVTLNGVYLFLLVFFSINVSCIIGGIKIYLLTKSILSWGNHRLSFSRCESVFFELLSCLSVS